MGYKRRSDILHLILYLGALLLALRLGMILLGKPLIHIPVFDDAVQVILRMVAVLLSWIAGNSVRFNFQP